MKSITKYEAELVLFQNSWTGPRPLDQVDNKLILPFQSFKAALQAKKDSETIILKKKLELKAEVLIRSGDIFLIIKFKN